MNYEINFLILQSQTENIDKIRKSIKGLIQKNEGSVTDELKYQKRKLAYEIKHEQYGFYTVYRFDLENVENLKELTKDLNLEKGITRHIIVKSNEIPKLQKEIGKAPKTEEERKAEALKKSPKKKVGQKVLDEISKETTKQISSKKESVKKSTITQEKETKEDTKIEKLKEKNSSKDKKISFSEKTAPKKEETKKKNEKEPKEGEISMDDLDKKLDEILDI